MFEDRMDAAEQLARALAGYQGQHPLVLGIPRGAVPIAAVIARRLEGELDLVLVRSCMHPAHRIRGRRRRRRVGYMPAA